MQAEENGLSAKSDDLTRALRTSVFSGTRIALCSLAFSALYR